MEQPDHLKPSPSFENSFFFFYNSFLSPEWKESGSAMPINSSEHRQVCSKSSPGVLGFFVFKQHLEHVWVLAISLSGPMSSRC